MNNQVRFRPYPVDLEFWSFIMNGWILKETTCFATLLGLSFTPDLNWNSYMRTIGYKSNKMVGSLH